MPKKKIATTKHYLIFDIDSATIGGGLFRFGFDATGSCTQIDELFSVRKPIFNQEDLDFEKFFDRTLATLDTVAEAVYLQSLISLDAIYCNISMPWMSAQKHIINYNHNTDFELSESLIRELLQKEQSHSFSKNTQYKNHTVEIIDQQVLDIYVNGYKTRKGIGMLTNDLSIHSLTSVVSASTREAFSHVIERVFHRSPEYLSNTHVSYQSVRKYLPHSDNAVVIDIAGEMTEVVVIRHDRLEHIGSFPVGISGIVRTLQQKLNIPYAKAHRLFELYHHGKLDAVYMQKITKSIHESFTVWFKPFFNLCDSFAKEGLLPNTLVLRGYTDIDSWIEYMILQDSKLAEHMHAAAHISVEHIHALANTSQKDTDPELAFVAQYLASRTTDDYEKETKN